MLSLGIEGDSMWAGRDACPTDEDMMAAEFCKSPLFLDKTFEAPGRFIMAEGVCRCCGMMDCGVPLVKP